MMPWHLRLVSYVSKEMNSPETYCNEKYFNLDVEKHDGVDENKEKLQPIRKVLK